jgi:2-keto-3-deoxy-L-rhamnonate aldolase RhmA
MVPRLETATEVSEVVGHAMYPPTGNRGLALGVSHDDYRGDDIEKTVAEANENTVIVIQIETRSALECVDEITATPGVAIAWFGPHDFALECGLTGESGAEALYEAASAIAASCRRAGIVAGIQPSTVDEATRYVELGYRCISFGKDSAVYLEACRAGVNALRRS